MVLQLQRPLAVLDIETTGTSLTQDRIVELCVVKLMPDGERREKCWLIDPEMTIPAEVIAIHGITDEMVKADGKKFKTVANEIKQFLEGCDLGGYNSNRFDLPILIEEFARINIKVDFDQRRLVDVQQIFHRMEQRTLAAAYRFYVGREIVGHHRAMNDALATLDVLLAQVERYPQLGNTVDSICKQTGDADMVDLARRFTRQNGVVVFNFGKHKGKAVTEVLKAEPSYYDWMMKGDFSSNTKDKLTEQLNLAFLKR